MRWTAIPEPTDSIGVNPDERESPSQKAHRTLASIRLGSPTALLPNSGQISKPRTSHGNTQASCSMLTFIHSGDAGDLIYALPVIKHIAPAGADLILGTKQRVRAAFSPEWGANIIPLLEIQPYIKGVRIQVDGDSWTHDMDPFRNLVFTRTKRGKNLTSYTCDVFGVPYSCADQPWLSVDYPVHVGGCPVVVNRTSRYNNPNFPWVRVCATYRDRMVFVGTKDEWERFSFAYGSIPYCPTSNALELARMIAGCRLFIGNQSLCYAIAEGLKQNTLQETFPRFPDCIFGRHNATIGLDGRVPLPDLNKLP